VQATAQGLVKCHKVLKALQPYDLQLLLRVVKRTLSVMSTLCSDSAEQFLDSGARHQASCLIADICMPGMSGIELQARLKAEHCETQIIFITARGDIPLAVSAMKEGASDFLAKLHESKKCCRCWSAV
jgi:FixJ family two-component response regulator